MLRRSMASEVIEVPPSPDDPILETPPKRRKTFPQQFWLAEEPESHKGRVVRALVDVGGWPDSIDDLTKEHRVALRTMYDNLGITSWDNAIIWHLTRVRVINPRVELEYESAPRWLEISRLERRVGPRAKIVHIRNFVEPGSVRVWLLPKKTLDFIIDDRCPYFLTSSKVLYFFGRDYIPPRFDLSVVQADAIRVQAPRVSPENVAVDPQAGEQPDDSQRCEAPVAVAENTVKRQGGAVQHVFKVKPLLTAIELFWSCTSLPMDKLVFKAWELSLAPPVVEKLKAEVAAGKLILPKNQCCTRPAQS